MPNPASLVHPIHFEDFDGSQFERLVFAHHWRSDDWRSLEWYGQAGSDLGRDIWGIRENATKDGESICIQCANRKNLTFAKVAQDISKVLKAPNGVPHRFRVVAQSTISAKMRDKIKAHVKSLGVQECDTWSGQEFEEFLRKGAESLLKRFIEGESFPDAPEDLRKLATSTQPVTDDESLALFARESLIVLPFTRRFIRKAIWEISNRPLPIQSRLSALESGKPVTAISSTVFPPGTN